MIFKKIGIVLLLVLFAACSTQRNTWLSRNYNNLTARYNVLYNGKESFKQGENSLNDNYRDNYIDVLSLFPYSGEEKAGSVRGEMDRAITKGQKLIREKSIKVKPKRKPGRDQLRYAEFYNQREFNRWVDDAYLLVGKAHLYNHDFNEAIVNFDYILREFPNHPVRFEALIWMARTRVEMGEYENALILLNQYDAIGKAPNRLYGEFMATYADYLIRQKLYEAAIPFMITAADMAQNKWNKARRNYILAQLYQQSGQYQLAHDRFLKVIHSNPEYEMNLNARLNLAILEGQLGGDVQSTRKELTRFVRQLKNEDYRDRIYYILAQSYINEHDTVNTITNLKLSAGYNIANQDLKGEALLQLASLYFDDNQYIPSYSYYDSTLMVLKNSDVRLKDINFRYNGLKELVQHYRVIYTEDSVRRIASMLPVERDIFIDNLIEQQELAQAKSKQDKDVSMADDPLFYRNYSEQLSGKTDEKGQWYFYNPTTVSLGKMDFEKRWGKRVSEDNWRRADKGTIAPVETSDLVSPDFPQELKDPAVLSDGTITAEKSEENKAPLPTREILIAGLPLTDEKMAESDKRLANALFNAGMVFFDQFEDYSKAVAMFRKVITEFPQDPLAEQAWFWAFRCYALLNNPSGMDEMKSGLLSRFPNSRYTAFVTDPDFVIKQELKNQELNDAYEKAFWAYKRNNYQLALENSKTVIISGEKEELKRKSYLLSAITHGKLGDNAAFESELDTLAGKYSTSVEGILAAKWLAMLAQGREPVAGLNKTEFPVEDELSVNADTLTDKLAEMFSFEPDSSHSLILIVNEDADLNRLLFNLADYNFSRFLLADYDIETKSLPDGQRVITIGTFLNNREAMDYFYGVRENSGLFKVDNIGTTLIFAGSSSNIVQLVSSGDLAGFRNFFSEKYLYGSSGTKITPGVEPKQPVSENDKTKTSDPELVNAENSKADNQNIDEIIVDKDSSKDAGLPLYETSEGLHWGMILLPAKANRNRVSTYLANYAYYDFNIEVTVRVETLSSGDVVMLIESFENAGVVSKFFESLGKISFWNTQLGARNWSKTAISPSNFEIMKREGSVVKYLEYYKENYHNK